MTNLKINDKYQQLWTTNKRYILITGGRGSSKSFTSSVYINEQSFNEHFKALVTRFTMKSAKDSIIPEFNQKVEILGLQNYFKSTVSDVVNLHTGNEILFRGVKTSSGDQTANLKSLEGITHFVIEEGEEFTDEDTFDTIDLSVRNKNAENKVIIIMNPSNTNHWVYKRWIAATHKIIDIDGVKIPISTHPDVCHIHTTYLDNKENLEKGFLDIITKAKESKPLYYKHKVIGAWKSHTEGAVITELNKFKRSQLSDETRCIGYIDVADEGNDYTAYVIGYVTEDGIYVTDVINDQSNTTVTLPRCKALSHKLKPAYIRCEANNMGAMFGRSLRDDYKGGKTLLVNQTTKKHTRILMEAPFIEDYFYFLVEEERNEEYQKFINLICSYDKDEAVNKKNGTHDDQIDALAGLSAMARSFYGKVFSK